MTTRYWVIFLFTIFSLVHFSLTGQCTAAVVDRYRLEVSTGKPAASPNPAAIDESVAFSFIVALFDEQGNQIEEVPAEVKSIAYNVSCATGSIKQNQPVMNISGDKHSASRTQRLLYASVSSTASFPTVGKHTLTLSVTVTFDNGSSIKMPCAIPVDVVTATLTVYADPPKNPVPMAHILPNAIAVTGDDIGHSFWKIEVEKKNEWGTDRKINLLDANGVPGPPSQDVVGCPYGFYPVGWDKMTLALLAYDGTIGDDSRSGHLDNAASKSYSITIEKAKAVVDETVNLVSGHKYHLHNIGGKNCTKQCVHISNDVAGCNAPNGIGMIGWRPNENVILASPSFFPFANPYHHAIQLSK